MLNRKIFVIISAEGDNVIMQYADIAIWNATLIRRSYLQYNRLSRQPEN